MTRFAVWLPVLFCLVPGRASAHLVSTRFGELYSGMLHPLTTLAHVVPFLAIGLLSGLQATQTARLSPWLLPLAAGLGCLLGASLPALAAVTYLNLGSFVVLGLLVATALQLPAPAFVAVSVVFGVSHGYENALPTLTGGAQLLYVLGVILAAYALVTLVAGAAQALRARTTWGALALRAAGSWIVAIGLVFGGFTLLNRP